MQRFTVAGWSGWPDSLRTAASGALAIIGAGAKNPAIWLHYAFKPLPTLLIFLAAWRTDNSVNPRYRHAVWRRSAAYFS
jgi:hypothetical protein